MKKRILSLLLALLILFSALGVSAEGNAAPDVSVNVTVSVEGVLAKTNDGDAMLNQSVTAKDINADGKITVDEALVAAHKAYNTESGYASAESYGYFSATKLWGTESGNLLFFKNNEGISGVGIDEVAEGDSIFASVNKDNTYYADWYAFFDKSEAEVEQGAELTLTLKGHLGMAYVDEDKKDVALSGIKIGTWEDGAFSEISGKTTDEEGKVTLTFGEEGTYIVTAYGTVRDMVDDYSKYPPEKVEANCPIMAPGVTVTVTKKNVPKKDDADAVQLIYNEFSQKTYSSMNNTTLVFPLEYEGKTYNNVLEYMKAWAYFNTGCELSVEYTYVNGVTSVAEWDTGTLKKRNLIAFRENGDIVTDYFKDNNPTAQRMSNVYFKVGNEKSAKVASIYVKSKSKVRTAEGMVDYTLSNIPFERIKNTNESQDEVVSTLGEKINNVFALTKPLTDMLYTAENIAIEWSAENKGGNSDALKLDYDTKNKYWKTTVTRPNVGEGDAEFNLKAEVTSGDVTKEKTFDITIPEFEKITVPLKVTEGAKVTLTDGYYKKAVPSKYIDKKDTKDGFDIYELSLHLSATGAKQAFTYKVEKDGFLSKSGTISVTDAENDEVEIELIASSAKDAKLGSIEFVSPTVKDFDFSSDKTSYEVDVKGARSIKIIALPAVEGAQVKLTSYYSSLKNADNGKLTTTGKVLSSSAVECFIPNNTGEAVIKILVTAPEGSVQSEKTTEYVLKVNKTEESLPLEKLSISASSTLGGIKNNLTIGDMTEEEVLSPIFVNGGKEDVYNYTVNYFRDQVTVTPTATDCTIKVNDVAVQSGKASAKIALNVGNNTIKVAVTDAADKTTEYKINVRRKQALYLTDIKVKEGILTSELKGDGKNWSATCGFNHDAETIHVAYHTNVTEDVTVVVTLNGEIYTAQSGEEIALPIGNADYIVPSFYVERLVDGVKEAQSFVVSFTRMSSGYPDVVETYLPAPGQFVNMDDSWGNPNSTLTAKGAVTLGAFGGNVVYKYNEPIKNDSKNPYGIDFLITGNCFTDSDGTTSSAAAEPAAVMVSKDGVTWYELAGSEYYTAEARHDLTVTYQNKDTEFSGAVEVPWTNSDGESGEMPTVSVHPQSYYPNPDAYGKYQDGIGKNESYNVNSVSFSGTMIEYGFYPFGYADTHSYNAKYKNKAVNPYSDNHKAIYNSDGFDISWAVDDEGNPVKLDEISYIKIYNPVLSYGTSRGEISPEILSVITAEANDKAVGVTDELSELYVNGNAITLADGVFSYDMDGEGAASLLIKAVSQNENANIYISNQRVKSGTESNAIAAVDKLRIIVQEGEKEPLIYILNLRNVQSNENNAELLSLELSPGTGSETPDENGKIAFETEKGVTAVRFTAKLGGRKATAVLTGDSLKSPVSLTNKTAGEAVEISKGTNEFKLTVTSANGENVKDYSVTVTRKDSSSQNKSDTIKVKFSLTGDIVHLGTNKKHTEKTWVSQRTVTLPKGSTVKYLTELILNNEGIDYTTDGIYVSEINSLAEFDNGPNSGWMFRHNGVLANQGYADRKLSDGDVVKWFYTDDYTKETGYEGKWDIVNGNQNSNKKDDDKVTVSVDVPKKDVSKYKDVPTYVWYYNAVKFVTEKKLFLGISDDEFAPDMTMTRAMLITVLYRLENANISEYNRKFSDVSSDAWYYNAVTWGVKNGIISGVSETEFCPDETITREQLATILHRYACIKGIAKEKNADISVFGDYNNVSSWAIDALSWANAAGVVKGTSKTTLSPSNGATRAEVAEMLMRFCAKL